METPQAAYNPNAYSPVSLYQNGHQALPQQKAQGTFDGRTVNHGRRSGKSYGFGGIVKGFFKGIRSIWVNLITFGSYHSLKKNVRNNENLISSLQYSLPGPDMNPQNPVPPGGINPNPQGNPNGPIVPPGEGYWPAGIQGNQPVAPQQAPGNFMQTPQVPQSTEIIPPGQAFWPPGLQGNPAAAQHIHRG